MENIQDQIRELQTSVRRQRFAIVTLAIILAGSAIIGAVRPAGDATFDTITCKGWQVVDEDGKERIKAFSSANGVAVAFLDENGNKRITAGTSFRGDAGVEWRDRHETPRMGAVTTADGSAFLGWNSKGGGRHLLIDDTRDDTKNSK